MVVLGMPERNNVLLNTLNLVLRVLHNNLVIFVLDISRVLHQLIYLPLLAKEQLVILVLLVCLILINLRLKQFLFYEHSGEN